eukprot:symbB.v1.2.006386.t1/scaffold358.1/size381540/9
MEMMRSANLFWSRSRDKPRAATVQGRNFSASFGRKENAQKVLVVLSHMAITNWGSPSTENWRAYLPRVDLTFVASLETSQLRANFGKRENVPKVTRAAFNM